MERETEMKDLDKYHSPTEGLWKEEDLEDIMALLNGDYQKTAKQPAQQSAMKPLDPQPSPQVVEKAPEQSPESIQQKLFQDEEPGRRTMELPDLRELLGLDDEQPVKPAARPLPREKGNDGWDMDAFVPQEPQKTGLGETAVFEDKPEKPEKDRVTMALSLLTVVEVMLLAATVIGLIQWMG